MTLTSFPSFLLCVKTIGFSTVPCLSVVAEHAWESHHPINWKDTSVINRARRPEELLLKEAIHIQGIPAGECLNASGMGGREFPGVGRLH